MLNSSSSNDPMLLSALASMNLAPPTMATAQQYGNGQQLNGQAGPSGYQMPGNTGMKAVGQVTGQLNPMLIRALQMKNQQTSSASNNPNSAAYARNNSYDQTVPQSTLDAQFGTPAATDAATSAIGDMGASTAGNAGAAAMPSFTDAAAGLGTGALGAAGTDAAVSAIGDAGASALGSGALDAIGSYLGSSGFLDMLAGLVAL